MNSDYSQGSVAPRSESGAASKPAAASEWQAWIGRSETLHDTVTAAPVRGLNATLDHLQIATERGTALPPLWHWLYFLSMHQQSEIGPDGHPKRGGFMPPVPLPRRMWAGSQFEFRAPLCIGHEITRTSTIEDVTTKVGRSGTLVFVKVRHEVRRNAETEAALVEFHDIVYRDAQQPTDPVPVPQPAPVDQVWQRELVADETLLFRYSALTFNGHRIHYDRRYAVEVEGYPGLVVHGPLLATLLLDLLRRERPEADVATFRFKAIRPTFDGQPFQLRGAPSADGRSVHLWACDHDGWLTMDATATLR